VSFTFVNLNFEVVVFLFTFANGKTQWKFGGASNDKSSYTTDK